MQSNEAVASAPAVDTAAAPKPHLMDVLANPLRAVARAAGKALRSIVALIKSVKNLRVSMKTQTNVDQ